MQRDLISSSKQTKKYFTNTIWHPGNTKISISIMLVLSLLKALDSSSIITLIRDLIYCKFSLQYCLKEEVSYFSYQCISSSILSQVSIFYFNMSLKEVLKYKKESQAKFWLKIRVENLTNILSTPPKLFLASFIAVKTGLIIYP